jgi:uncharacterized radical SAM superfamily Fe-S cluster-containing enzyme
MNEYQVTTYGSSTVLLEGGEYTIQDLIDIIKAMGQLNQHNRAQIDAVMLASDPAGLKKREKK